MAYPKILTDIENKVDKTDVVTVATANKILKLNSSGKLPCGITGDASSISDLTLTKSNQKWECIPNVGANGVMEVGKHIDFHNTSSESVDYSNRITSDTSGNLLINNIYSIWHSGNDGSGSGLDADKLDGKESTVLCPTGEVSFFARSTAPTGWLKCNGSTVSRTAYATLFNAIGTTFGNGDGSTTFKLPDLRGEFIRGWDDSRGVDKNRVFGSSQSDDFKIHNHRENVANKFNVASGTSTGVYGLTGGSTNPSPTFGPAFQSTCDTGGSETRPRNIALLACIRY